ACELAKHLENKGLYEEARRAISAYWPHPDERPLVKDLSPGVAAELLLRAGVITGALGGKTQLTGAQEAAKNLISESLSHFQSPTKDRGGAGRAGALLLAHRRG